MKPRPPLKSVNLCGGDFIMTEQGSKTVLLAVVPIDVRKKTVSINAKLLSGYNPAAWGEMKRLAKKFQNPDLLAEIEKLEMRRRSPDTIELCDGFYLTTSGPHTTLGSPTSRQYISASGKYETWSMERWKSFAENAHEAFGNAQLDGQLQQMIEMRRQELVWEELPLVDKSAPYPHFLGLHALELRFSSKEIILIGKTYKIKDELKEFMGWDPETKIWRAQFSENVLKRVIKLLRKHDRVSDPAKEGLVQCWVCGSWGPKDKAVQGADGEWYDGCIGPATEEDKMNVKQESQNQPPITDT